MKYPDVAALFDNLELMLVEIAAIVGVRPPTVTRWRAGESRPAPHHWRALAEALDVDVQTVRDACTAIPLDGAGVLHRHHAAAPERLPVRMADLERSLSQLAADVAQLRGDLDGFFEMRASQFAWVVEGLELVAERTGVVLQGVPVEADGRDVAADDTSSSGRPKGRSSPGKDRQTATSRRR